MESFVKIDIGKWFDDAVAQRDNLKIGEYSIILTLTHCERLDTDFVIYKQNEIAGCVRITSDGQLFLAHKITAGGWAADSDLSDPMWQICLNRIVEVYGDTGT